MAGPLAFTKMHGLGNDFVVVDELTSAIDLTPADCRFLADRRRGVGCDQVLVVTRPAEGRFGYLVFNADGSTASQCGNGARCVARYLRDRGHVGDAGFVLESPSGPVRAEFTADGVRIGMGVPGLRPADVPFDSDSDDTIQSLEAGGRTLEITVVSMGNPHAVTFVDDPDTAPVAELGPLIDGHPRFPEGANAGFAAVETPGRLRLRVYERGVGETLACGSGACAAMVAANRRGKIGEEAVVTLPGGDLVISWKGIGEPVFMTGPAETVFEGKTRL